ncbi:MAG: YdcF family protein [Cyanobacteria bacterium P01_A01_bin.37]
MVQGLVSPLPQSSEVAADTIVMLGRGGGWADEQVETATQLWASNRDSQIFISGNSIETEILSEKLLKEGIPSEQISGEYCSRSTEDNARFTKAILADKQIHQITLVTDEPHMLRSLLTFQSFGFQVSHHPVELPDEMNDFTVSKIALREYLALISYASLGRFQQRSSIELQNLTECLITPDVND